MILSSDQILEELQEIWPDFEWEIPKNPYFTALPDEMLPDLIKVCSIKDKYHTIPGIWECENYSGKWQANAESYIYELYISGKWKPKYRPYFQDAFGKEHGLFGDTNHSKNLIRLESGWVLFEPQTDQISRDYKSFTLIVGEA